MEDKKIKDFFNWAVMELRIKHAENAERSDLSCEILKQIKSYKEKHPEFSVSDILNEFSLLFMGCTLSPVFDTEADWKICDGDDLLRHRRHQSLYKGNDGKLINLDRFIVRDISNPENPETREPCDMEAVLLNKIYPIEFPYFQQRAGILYTVRIDKYAWFVKYLDECSGEYHNLNKYFDISDEVWKEVPFSECMKTFMNTMYGKKDKE